MTQKALTIIFILFIANSTRGSVHAAIFYTSPSGDDTAVGTLNSPFKTISRCINALSAGDTCSIRAGSYPESPTVSKKGTAADPITIAAHNNETVVIDGNNTRPTFNLSSAEHITLKDLKLSKSSSYALYADNTKNITISGFEVDHPLDGGLIFRNSQNVLIENSNVHHTNFRGDGSHEAISMVNTSDFEIRNNQVHDSLEEGIDAKYGAKNGKIHHNTVYGNGGPNIYIDAASDIKIYNNHVHSAKGDKANIGLAVEYHQNRYLTENIEIYNNILRSSPGGVSFWVEAEADSYASFNNIRIYHNLFYGNQARGAYRLGAAAPYASNIELTNNIFWKNTQNIDVLTSLNASYNLFDSSPKGSNSITSQDLKFVNENGFDFRLSAGSPAIDAGSPTTLISYDFADQSRPHNRADIGPYEYQTGATLPSTAPSVSPSNRPGDLNGDGFVNYADFNHLITHFGTRYTIAHFNAIITNYGQ